MPHPPMQRLCNLSFAVTCLARNGFALAVTLALVIGGVLVIGKDIVSKGRNPHELSCLDVEGIIFHAVFAVWTLSHLAAAPTARAFVTAVARTYGATHTSVSFLIDQHV